MKKLLTLFAFVFLCAWHLSAQDQLFLRGKEDPIKVKVVEVGTTEIRYKLWPVEESMPIMAENKDRIRKIIFANGSVMKFVEDEFDNANNYANQRKIAVKIDPFAITRGVISLAGEYSLKPGMSTELGLGYIGVGNYDNSELWSFSEAQGFFMRAGVKFINTPDFRLKGMRYAHLLKGGYIRPELVFISNTNSGNETSYIWNGSIYTYSDRNYEVKINGGAFMLNFGKQWVFSDIFLVDFFLGPGIGAKKLKYFVDGVEQPIDYYDPSVTGMFAYTTVTDQPGKMAFCFQTGLKVGVLIGAKAEK